MGWVSNFFTLLGLISELLTLAREARQRGEGQQEALGRILSDAKDTVRRMRVDRVRTGDELRAHDQFERDS